MILLCGIASETPVQMVVAALRELGLAHAVIQQRRFLETELDIAVAGGEVRGQLVVDGQYIRCDEVTGIYARLHDWAVLPEIAGAPADSEARRRCRDWHEAVSEWLEVSPTRVVNRGGAMASNRSKPYQLQLIRA